MNLRRNKMKRTAAACLAILLLPLTAAQAENWKNKVTKPGTSVTQWGAVRCVAGNCWCRSKRKTFTPGETCQCGSAPGVLKYEGQIGKGMGQCS
jgi:hypothetical protein